MLNKVRKGNRYRLKTRKWLEAKGYLVEILEHSGMYGKKDIWGADLIAKNKDELIFIQVKSNKAHLSMGKKELLATVWPPFVKLWVVCWEPYSKKPIVVEVVQLTDLGSQLVKETIANAAKEIYNNIASQRTFIEEE